MGYGGGGRWWVKRAGKVGQAGGRQGGRHTAWQKAWGGQVVGVGGGRKGVQKGKGSVQGRWNAWACVGMNRQRWW